MHEADLLQRDPSWFFLLEERGDAPALISDTGERWTYAELAAHADRAAGLLDSDGRRLLVALMVRNDLASIATYIGALRAGHAVLLLAAGQKHPAIIDTFAPDRIWDAESGIVSRGPNAPADLHSDLLLMLSTSGSTGSPKLVRLSADAVAANAASIIRYLDIDPAERAITTLPFHYSYGLSVLHSHLMAGASLAVTELSLVHPQFLPFLRSSEATSIAGVPYVYELLEKSGLEQQIPATIRTMTQAGGRLAPERVRALAARGAEQGFRFIPMYGQTEATARMAWLPPELVADHSDCIGRPIPGGHFTLVDDNGAEIHGNGIAGELVYTGPNVMMGYGLARADLARGHELDRLHTGDIAERTEDGLYRIVGRASRFAKIAGLRIGFDDLEAILRERGLNPAVTGTDRLITAWIDGEHGEAERRAIASALAERAHIPESSIAILSGTIPRLPTGKVDYGSIRMAGEAAAAATAQILSAGAHPILSGYRRAFNRPGLSEDASFQSLGGDSLSYVNVSIAIEQALGHLPERWEEMPVSALIALAPKAGDAPVVRSPHTLVGSETLIRLFALALVIIGHAAPDQTEFLRGGANILFLLAGFSFARFQRSAVERGEWRPVLGGTLERMILPYYLLMIPMLFASTAERSIGWFTLTSVFMVDNRGPLFAFWFIETLFHALLLILLVYAVPGVRALSRAKPFLFGLGLLAFAVVLKIMVSAFIFDDFNPISLTVDNWFYLYALGFMASVSRTTLERLVVLVLAVLLLGWAYGLLAPRLVWTGLALLPLLFLPFINLPNRFAGIIMRLGAASYFIYMVHVVMHHIIHHILGLSDRPALSIMAMLTSSVIGGLIAELLWSRIIAVVRSRFGQ